MEDMSKQEMRALLLAAMDRFGLDKFQITREQVGRLIRPHLEMEIRKLGRWWFDQRNKDESSNDDEEEEKAETEVEENFKDSQGDLDHVNDSMVEHEADFSKLNTDELREMLICHLLGDLLPTHGASEIKELSRSVGNMITVGESGTPVEQLSRIQVIQFLESFV